MATTPTTRVTSLARSHRLDLDLGAYPAVNYAQLLGVEEAKLIEDIRTDDDETYPDGGAMRETNTGYSWRLELKLAYSTNLAGAAILPEHAFLRTRFKALRTSRAEQNEFGVRFYHRDGLDDGHNHEGRVYVKSWALPGGKGRDTIDVVLQGQGPLVDIVNPLANATPLVYSLVPAAGGTAAGGLVQINGQKLTGATAVSFGGTAATNFVVISDGVIVATKPALTAGSKDVTVTTPGGTSVTAGVENDFVVS